MRLGETLAMGVEPGGRARVLALVRNQSGIVDNYELSVRGLPDGWWSIFPNTVYLSPFGTSGTYEQEVEIHLHPPRSPEAEARIWELQVTAESKAYNRQAAGAPLNLGIQPFEELKTKLEPERASGRRKASYEVAVKNTANAAITVALDHEDPDNELKVGLRARGRSRSRPARRQVADGGPPAAPEVDRPPGGEAPVRAHPHGRGGARREGGRRGAAPSRRSPRARRTRSSEGAAGQGRRHVQAPRRRRPARERRPARRAGHRPARPACAARAEQEPPALVSSRSPAAARPRPASRCSPTRSSSARRRGCPGGS